jgi:arylsulfatase
MHRRLSLLAVVAMVTACLSPVASFAQEKKPNVLVIWGDDIGTWNISHNNRGMMGYQTPNIDRIASEGIAFTDYYGQQSCTAGRAAFLGGNVPVRTGMTKVGIPSAPEGWQKTDVTIATVMKSVGYATGQFGKNHQGDRDEHLPTMHGFDEFFGNLYHLNAEEEPENEDYPADMVMANGKTFIEVYGPRGVLKCKADGKGGQTIEDTGPLTRKRMETIDDESIAAAKDFIKRQNDAGKPFFCWWNGTRMHFRTHVREEHRHKGNDKYTDGMISHAHDRDFYRAWAEVSVFERFEPPERKYAAGAAYLRGQGAGEVLAVEGLEALRRELGELIVEAQLPRAGQPKASSYEGEGYILLRHPDTAVVAEGLEHVVSTLRVRLGAKS